ncbi:MAG TPA: serine acetyltransferase [Anaeromyxobacteraceae bacterium]|nr:serine acetyltransferase [Anaeromyxobacteraceae bacterium]
MFSRIRADARELMRVEATHIPGEGRMARYRPLWCDTFSVTVWQRTREFLRRARVPLANRIVRRIQLAFYGIDLGNDITLGSGVSFVHTVGIVIGGTAKVGNRVRFMGSNTVGTAKDNGYPVIEDDVEVGAGARILGPVRIGARSVVGANAVVIADVPADSVAIGIPARSRSKA